MQNSSASTTLQGVSTGTGGGLTVESRDGALTLDEIETGTLSLQNSSARIALSHSRIAGSLNCAVRDGSLGLEVIQADSLTLSCESAAAVLNNIRGLDGGRADSLIYTGSDAPFSLEDAVVREIKLGGASGSIKLLGLEANALTLDNRDGSVTLENCQTDGLRLSNTSGSVTLVGVFRGVSDITTENGSVHMTNAVSKEETAWNLRTVSGSITVDGVKQSGGTYRSENLSMAHHITINAGDSDIEVSFTAGQ